jgi:cold shock CspA family protein
MLADKIDLVALEPPQPARVKWYREDKGYGFVTLTDSGEDLFLSQRVVGVGVDLPAGTTLTVRAGLDRVTAKPTVLEVVDIDRSTALPATRPAATGPTRTETGVLRLRTQSGAGFLRCDFGGPDIYIPRGCFLTPETEAVQVGDKIEADAADGDGGRGPIAVRIRRL